MNIANTFMHVCIVFVSLAVGICYALDSPYYETFDGSIYAYLSNCQNVLVRDCMDQDTNTPYNYQIDVLHQTSSDNTTLSSTISEVIIDVLGTVRYI